MIAWRLAAHTHLGRRTPGLDAALMFSEAELAELGNFAKIRRARRSETLGDAMMLAAMLGGFLNRKNDRPPGHQFLWDGQFRLAQQA
ncbi:MAG: IS4 family transposase [Albidovulum sp.]|nr:IS4 family transposase [Albidovulum sp.]